MAQQHLKLRFCAAVWETFTGLSDDARFVLRELAAHGMHGSSSNYGATHGVLFAELQEQLSTTIMRANAAMVFARMPRQARSGALSGRNRDH